MQKLQVLQNLGPPLIIKLQYFILITIFNKNLLSTAKNCSGNIIPFHFTSSSFYLIIYMRYRERNINICGYIDRQIDMKKFEISHSLLSRKHFRSFPLSWRGCMLIIMKINYYSRQCVKVSKLLLGHRIAIFCFCQRSYHQCLPF